MNRLILKEAFAASLLTLALTLLISKLPLKLEFAKPIKQEFADFDVYDLIYTNKNRNTLSKDTSIVVIQVADTRDEIARQLSIISQYHPKIIGVDAFFRHNSARDSSLMNQLSRAADVVIGSRLELDTTTEELTVNKGFLQGALPDITSGYINFSGEELSVVRYFAPCVQINKNQELSFDAAILKKANPECFNALLARNKDLEIINYYGGQNNFITMPKEAFDYYHKSKQLSDKLTGKIVLLGFFTENQPPVLEDIHFTPLNNKLSGKSFPDMYGVIIHANILTMLLKKNYAILVPQYISYLIGGVLSFMLLWLYLREEYRHKHPAHLKYLALQFFIILVLIYFFLLLFDRFALKIQLLPIIVTTIISIELLDIYKWLSRLLNKLFRYSTIFAR